MEAFDDKFILGGQDLGGTRCPGTQWAMRCEGHAPTPFQKGDKFRFRCHGFSF